MNILDYAIAIIALVWLGYLAVHEVRKDPPVHITWILFPLVIAAVFRLTTGPAMIVLVAVILVVVSDRRHLNNRIVEWLFLIATLLGILLILTYSDPIISVAGVCMLIVWIGWEFHLASEQEAIVLIACLLLWPSVSFLVVYMAISLLWFVGIRIKERGWRQKHWSPAMSLIAASALVYLVLRAIGVVV